LDVVSRVRSGIVHRNDQDIADETMKDLAASQPVERLGVEDASHRQQCRGGVAVPELSLSRVQSASEGSDAIDPVRRITGIV
jgi:hypothetical protein